MKIQPAAGDVVPVLRRYYQRMKIQPAAGDVVPVLRRYYQRRKIQPPAGDGRSSTKVVLPEKENPAGRRRGPLQY